MRKIQIAVIGSAGSEEYPYLKPEDSLYSKAYEIGKLLAIKNIILVCGGKGGIMESACKGAKENGGMTAGVISGNQRRKSNPFIDVEVVSGIINASEDGIIISMADGVIALGGGSGTLQELTMAYRNKKPIVTIKNTKGWANKLAETYIDERKLIKIKEVATPKEAVDYILSKLVYLHYD